MTTRRRADFNAALLASLVLWAAGVWNAFFGSYGYDSVAFGVMWIGLGFVNVAVNIGGRARLWVFCVGASLFGAWVLYWLFKAAREVASTFA